MFELNPELASRQDKRFWYIDHDLKTVKPGDTVVVDMVIGERFGSFDRQEHLFKAATFLGNFKENEEDAMELAKHFVNPAELEGLSADEVEMFSRSPYFKAHFDEVGEITFCGAECFWYIPDS